VARFYGSRCTMMIATLVRAAEPYRSVRPDPLLTIKYRMRRSVYCMRRRYGIRRSK